MKIARNYETLELNEDSQYWGLFWGAENFVCATDIAKAALISISRKAEIVALPGTDGNKAIPIGPIVSQRAFH